MLLKPHRTVFVGLLVCVAIAFSCQYIWVQMPSASTSLQRGHYQQALKKLQLSAAENDAKAQLSLGNIYYAGLGIQRDFDLAFAWYKRSAMQANNFAQYNLGLMYLQGLGTKSDLVRAAAWFMTANSTGNLNAKTQLRKLSGTLSPNKLQQATRMHEETRMLIERSL